MLIEIQRFVPTKVGKLVQFDDRHFIRGNFETDFIDVFSEVSRRPVTQVDSQPHPKTAVRMATVCQPFNSGFRDAWKVEQMVTGMESSDLNHRRGCLMVHSRSHATP